MHKCAKHNGCVTQQREYIQMLFGEFEIKAELHIHICICICEYSDNS